MSGGRRNAAGARGVREAPAVIPQALVARCLGVSRQRVNQLVRDCKLASVEVDGVRYVARTSFEQYVKLRKLEERMP